MVVSQSKAMKKKLMAATSMLLVACIMLISSSYAWFTLSTAPEITGVATNVGANGNLEIALATTETWQNPESVSMTTGQTGTINDINSSWGNLVTLSDASYGLDRINLMPARLNYQGGLTDLPLLVPAYGSDGRITEFKNAMYGQKGEAGNFISSTSPQRGVNAIGLANAMTERESSYRTAKSDFSSGVSNGKKIVVDTLQANGSKLANIAVSHALDPDSKYTKEDYNAVKEVLEELKKISLKLDEAWVQAVIAYAASAKGEENVNIADEESFKAFRQAMITAGVTAYDQDTKNVEVKINDVSVQFELPEELQTFYVDMQEIKDAINEANKNITNDQKDEYEWSEISVILTPLINTQGVTVNGFNVDQLKENAGSLMNTIGQGISVELTDGSGIFYDIAKLCGNYSVQINLDINAGGMKIDNLAATLKTKAEDITANKVTAKLNSVGAPKKGGAANNVLTDLYGYQIDFLVRTNATSSDLLLQQEGAQRIYGESKNPDTQGLGSSMTFTSSNSYFTTEDMKKLMGSIRVVFFQENTLLSIAVLDTVNADVNGTEVKANLKLVNHTFDNNNVLKIEGDKTDQTLINGMGKNQVYKISALVYLDGDCVTNADVANATTSMTGSLNLQFASSTDLVPMEDASLRGDVTVDSNTEEASE